MVRLNSSNSNSDDCDEYVMMSLFVMRQRLTPHLLCKSSDMMTKMENMIILGRDNSNNTTIIKMDGDENDSIYNII